MRQTEGVAAQQLGGAYFFKLVQDAGGVRVVEQQELDHRLYFLLNQCGFGQGLIGVSSIGRMVSHALGMGGVLLV